MEQTTYYSVKSKHRLCLQVSLTVVIFRNAGCDKNTIILQWYNLISLVENLLLVQQ